ncbi:MAG: hypothetical protein K2Q33_01010, partial [Gammaproteobacteria bacterium]|nr:hypothetical protein [Gammaproteobacteria bacterium]
QKGAAAAADIVEGELDKSKGINTRQKRSIREKLTAALANISNEQERQYLIYCFHWCIQRLISQQPAKLTVSSASPFTPAASWLPLPENKGLGLAQVGRGISRDSGVHYSSSSSFSITRYRRLTRYSNDGSPSPYVAYSFPNGNMTITGNLQEGWKDMVQVCKAEGVNSVTVRGGELVANDAKAYQTLKTANDAGVTAVLGERGPYESGRLFAEQGAKENPNTYEADTKKYLNGMLDDETLGPRLREEMAQKGLGTKEELEKMGRDDLVEKCFEEMKSPKAEISPEGQSKVASEVHSQAAPEVKSRPSAPTPPRGENKILETAGRMNRNNHSTMSVGNQTIDITQNNSGEMFVGGHKMPEEFTGQNVKSEVYHNQLWINDKPVTVSKDGLTVDGRSVVGGRYAEASSSSSAEPPKGPRLG